MNLLGRWKDFASHPKIKDDELSPEDIELENKLVEGLDSAASEAKLAEPGQPRRRGLSGVQRDIKALANQVNKNDNARSSMETMMRGMGGGAGSPRPAGNPGGGIAPGMGAGGRG